MKLKNRTSDVEYILKWCAKIIKYVFMCQNGIFIAHLLGMLLYTSTSCGIQLSQ